VAGTDKKSIPVYSIDKFRRSGHGKQYEIEVFDKNRDFKVTYPHRHDFYEILFLTQGNGTHTIDANEYVIKQNCVFFLSPGQIHSLQLSDDIKGYIFLFTSEFYLLNKLDKNHLLELPFFYSLSNETPPLYLVDNKDINLITNLFAQACDENNQNLEESDDMIRSLLDIKGRLMVKRFKQLIEENYHKNLSIKEYASLLAVTPNHLSETVKELTGRTSSKLISDKLILEIKRMLLHTDLTVSEIAYQLNFADQSYFTKYFKTHTGILPNDFRKESIKST